MFAGVAGEEALGTIKDSLGEGGGEVVRRFQKGLDGGATFVNKGGELKHYESAGNSNRVKGGKLVHEG